ncbi:hypothetical protein TNCV_1913521 [Trichonephila clavipes]|nr:hypothetical protein TNCV_1913521 [Trichonephila clavipes]
MKRDRIECQEGSKQTRVLAEREDKVVIRLYLTAPEVSLLLLRETGKPITVLTVNGTSTEPWDRKPRLVDENRDESQEDDEPVEGSD